MFTRGSFVQSAVCANLLTVLGVRLLKRVLSLNAQLVILVYTAVLLGLLIEYCFFLTKNYLGLSQI